MAFATVVALETLRSVAQASITNAYLPIGTPITHNARAIRFINNTDGDLFISDDGTNNKYFVPKTSFVLYDFSSLSAGVSISYPLAYATGTQFYVKYSSAPTTGSLYLEVIYGV